MTTLIRDRKLVEDDWVHVDDDAPLPAGKVIVSHARWQKERAALSARGNVGVKLPSALPVEELKDYVSLPLIALTLDFIQPRPEGGRSYDGRGYTQARLLRERHNYGGEIRATGGVFRDAMYFMARCGVNAFEVRDPAGALEAFEDFSFGYQAASDGQTTIFRRRLPPT